MDDATYQALKTALAGSPENAELLAVVCQATLDRDKPNDLLVLLESYPDAAEAPTVLMLKSRALARLYREPEALRCYDQAVQANSTLEDAEFRMSLEIALPAAGGEGRVRATHGGDGDPNDTVSWLDSPQARVTFEDVGGLETLKDKIRKKIILPLQKPSLFQRFRRRAGGGVLLYGAPGCGKTLVARATAGETGHKFFNVQISDILNMYIGESEQRLHALFEQARNAAPAVVFFDEVEALGGKRTHARDSSSLKLVSQFLAEMDGFASRNDGVLILGATNVPWAVDPAFRRPGRFDRVMFVPPPDRAAREAILHIHLQERPTATDLDVVEISKQTSGYSGADLQHLIETAVDCAIEDSIERGEEVPIHHRHLVHALSDCKPTTLEWLTTARNYARYSNEAGQYDEVLEFLKKHGRA